MFKVSMVESPDAYRSILHPFYMSCPLSRLAYVKYGFGTWNEQRCLGLIPPMRILLVCVYTYPRSQPLALLLLMEYAFKLNSNSSGFPEIYKFQRVEVELSMFG